MSSAVPPPERGKPCLPRKGHNPSDIMKGSNLNRQDALAGWLHSVGTLVLLVTTAQNSTRRVICLAHAETPIFRGDQQVGAEILSDCTGASEYLPQSTTAQYSKRGHLVRVFRRLPLAGESAGRMPAPRSRSWVSYAIAGRVTLNRATGLSTGTGRHGALHRSCAGRRAYPPVTFEM